MAAPSEEDRRLLREYRIITVPPRRSSCLPPATSNASSSTIPSTPLAKNQVDYKQQQDHPQQTKESQQAQQQSRENLDQKSIRHHSSSNQQQQTNQAHHQNHHHHHHHHHHSNNHKRHKNTTTTTTHHVSVDDLNRMLELVSGLNYLKLVAPKNVNVSPTSPSQPLNIQTTIIPKSITPNGNSTRVVTNGNDPKLPYIFEKVDYIKKISIRRKALKKFKKAKIRAFSNNNNFNVSNNKTKKKDALTRTNGAD